VEESEKKVIEGIAFTLFLESWMVDDESIIDCDEYFIFYMKNKWINIWLPGRTSRHLGDCTNMCFSCLRCQVDEFFKQAEHIYNILEGK
jgi:hypothetical protein